MQRMRIHYRKEFSFSSNRQHPIRLALNAMYSTLICGGSSLKLTKPFPCTPFYQKIAYLFFRMSSTKLSIFFRRELMKTLLLSIIQLAKKGIRKGMNNESIVELFYSDFSFKTIQKITIRIR